MKNKYLFLIIGIAFSSLISCKKDKIKVPTVSTDSVYNINTSSEKVSGTLISNGGADILARGFCWSIIPNPTISDNPMINANIQIGSFSDTIKALIPQRTYYVCAFATNSVGTGYGKVISFTTDSSIAYKPNVYIYPEEAINLSVKLEFPLGGGIITSIPDYGNGWNVSVEPTGKINNQYTYLFYESKQPKIWQYINGWTVKKTELEGFFKENMKSYGFKGQEIQDFVDYWIPKFQKYSYYYIYPQTNNIIDKAVKISYSIKPNKNLRLYYVVKGSNDKPLKELIKPEINSFDRTGYFITEWGVIL